jgi:hypothetical protein
MYVMRLTLLGLEVDRIRLEIDDVWKEIESARRGGDAAPVSRDATTIDGRCIRREAQSWHEERRPAASIVGSGDRRVRSAT